MKQVNLSRALLGGFFATLVMTGLLYLAPYAGAPKMDIAAQLASLFHRGTPAPLTDLWWAGMVWHFFNGTVIFSLIYAYLVYGWLAGENWLRGLIWGSALWALMEVAVMPMIGMGVFSDHANHALTRVLSSFVLNAIYGVVLGAMAGTQAEHPVHMAHPA